MFPCILRFIVLSSYSLELDFDLSSLRLAISSVLLSGPGFAISGYIASMIPPGTIGWMVYSLSMYMESPYTGVNGKETEYFLFPVFAFNIMQRFIKWLRLHIGPRPSMCDFTFVQIHIGLHIENVLLLNGLPLSVLKTVGPPNIARTLSSTGVCWHWFQYFYHWVTWVFLYDNQKIVPSL